jgi:hypothetical protein
VITAVRVWYLHVFIALRRLPADKAFGTRVALLAGERSPRSMHEVCIFDHLRTGGSLLLHAVAEYARHGVLPSTRLREVVCWEEKREDVKLDATR